MLRSSDDPVLNQLARKVSSSFEGANILDCALVSAKMIAFALTQAFNDREEREAALEKLIEFINKHIAEEEKRKLQ